MPQDVYILGIESSCDDTSIAVLKNKTVLSNIVSSQEVHAEFGGVVPELASRAHQANIVPVLDKALKEANVSLDDIDAIAYTLGPGLLGSLLVGTSFAKGIAFSKNIPLLEVHHMKAHALAHFIDNNQYEEPLTFPFISLTVSGGHTQIVRVDSPDEMKVVGQTLDDAAGEAFDKVAKIMNLPYPGGPVLDKLAQQGNPKAFSFPISNIPDFNYSFSGLKTAVLYFLQEEMKKNPQFIEQYKADIAASVQYTIIETLFRKLIKAVEVENVTSIAISGGVSANSGLRKRLLAEGENRGWKTYIPKFEYCTDNGAMIGIAGYFKYKNGEVPHPIALNGAPKARWVF